MSVDPKTTANCSAPWLYAPCRRPYIQTMRFTIPQTLRSSKAADLATLAIVSAITLLDAWYNVEGTRQADAITYLLVATSIGALFFRRAWPLPVALVCMAALTTLYVLGHYGELLNLPTVVALYTVAVEGHRRRSIVVGASALTWSMVLAQIAQNTWPDVITDAGSPTLAEMLLPAAALLLGESVRTHRELLEIQSTRAAQAEADREREAARRVEEERLRIARELHDILAHTVAGINVQAGVAVDAFETKPEVAREAMRQVRASGREAIQELRATVAVLRESDDGTTPDPTPGLIEIPGLIESTRRSGVSATLLQDTGSRRLPAVVELAAYRIIQEALTNVIRHAKATNVAVSIRCEDDAVIVEVTYDGTPRTEGARDSVESEGFGLVGMAERAAAVGGKVEYGPMPHGGFRVFAKLPLDGDAS